MTNELQRMFDYAGRQVRTVIKEGEPWFVAKRFGNLYVAAFGVALGLSVGLAFLTDIISKV